MKKLFLWLGYVPAEELTATVKAKEQLQGRITLLEGQIIDQKKTIHHLEMHSMSRSSRRRLGKAVEKKYGMKIKNFSE